MLAGELSLHQIPVAVRMSWASLRQTTREEDMAYCLMGLFDINMPMLYGEGKKAFLRLQEELIKQNSNMSIFAWNRFELNFGHNLHVGLLASSRKDFMYMRYAVPVIGQIPEFSVGNRGLKFHLALGKCNKSELYVLPLGHKIGDIEEIGVYLR